MKSKLLALCMMIVALIVTTGRPAAIFAADATPTPATNAAREAAQALALKLVGGKAIGGTVSMMGVNGGAYGDLFLSVFKPFEDATGIKIDYEGTQDLDTVLQTRVDSGNPPDIIVSPSVGNLLSYAHNGKLVDLGQFMDVSAMKDSYGADLLSTFTIDGKLYGFFETASLEGLIWYNAKQYKGPNTPKDWAELEDWAAKTASSGMTPWCIGLESGANSGWPATNWITEILLRQAGPEKYDQWWQGKLAWTSPEVKAAFQTYGKIATDPKLVYGGATAVLATSFANGGDGLFSSPPNCYLHHQASFFGSIAGGNFPKLKPIDDIDFFAAPDFNTNYAGMFQISGDAMVMFNDTPQARAFITYAASVEAQTLLAATGGWLSPNKKLTTSVYPDPYLRKAAQVITDAKSVRVDGSLLMPGPMISAYLKAATRYVQNPDQLDSILSDLDAVQKDAYK